MKLLRINDVLKALNISRATFWRMRREGQFIAPIRISPNCFGFLESEFLNWVEEHRLRTRADAGDAGK